MRSKKLNLEQCNNSLLHITKLHIRTLEILKNFQRGRTLPQNGGHNLHSPTKENFPTLMSLGKFSLGNMPFCSPHK